MKEMERHPRHWKAIGRQIAGTTTRHTSTKQIPKKVPTNPLATKTAKEKKEATPKDGQWTAQREEWQQRKRTKEQLKKFPKGTTLNKGIKAAIRKRQRQQNYTTTLKDAQFKKLQSKMENAGMGIILLQTATEGTHVMTMEGRFDKEQCKLTTYRDRTPRTPFNSEANLNGRRFIAPGAPGEPRAHNQHTITPNPPPPSATHNQVH